MKIVISIERDACCCRSSAGDLSQQALKNNKSHTQCSHNQVSPRFSNYFRGSFKRMTLKKRTLRFREEQRISLEIFGGDEVVIF